MREIEKFCECSLSNKGAPPKRKRSLPREYTKNAHRRSCDVHLKAHSLIKAKLLIKTKLPIKNQASNKSGYISVKFWFET
jgi:hypothetical protein